MKKLKYDNKKEIYGLDILFLYSLSHSTNKEHILENNFF